MFCVERFLSWLDDSIPHHRFTAAMFWVVARVGWEDDGIPREAVVGTFETLRGVLDSPRAQELEGGRGVDMNFGWSWGALDLIKDQWSDG